jgi:soluble lytic murein transglycosylase
MAARRASKQSGFRRSRRGPIRSLLILAFLVAIAVTTVALLSDYFQQGVQEVTLPLRHDDIIRQQARDKGVDAALIASVIYNESRFRDQTSRAGARGLMQITPTTAKEIERLSGGTSFELSDLSDPDINIRYGTFYLALLLDLYDNDPVAALAAYNAGPSRADEWGGSGMVVDDITFPETRAYVKNVLEKQREYRHNYEEELGY